MMFVRKVGAAFGRIEGRDWALLGLETLSVVLGILIAFELNEWASQRDEQRRNHVMIERLFEESELDVTVLRDIQRTMRSNVDTQKRFVAGFSSPDGCPQQGLWDAASTVDMYPSVTAPHAVLDEMLAAGGLSSIGDLSIRKAIAQYAGYLEYAARQNEFFRDKHQQVIPPDDMRVTLTLDPAAGEPEVAKFDRPALCADRRFRNRMVESTRNQMAILDYRTAATDRAIAMCAKIGRALGKVCAPPDGPLLGDDAELARKALAKS